MRRAYIIDSDVRMILTEPAGHGYVGGISLDLTGITEKIDTLHLSYDEVKELAQAIYHLTGYQVPVVDDERCWTGEVE